MAHRYRADISNMSRTISYMLLATALAQPLGAARLPLGEQTSVPLVSGWQVEEGANEFPYHLYNEQRTAELLVFESVLENEEMVSDTAGFRETVDEVIQTIFYDLPDILILSNTGYYYDSLARFAVEFQSSSDEVEGRLYHRFEGILLRRLDDRQVLYALWGKASQEAAPNDLLDIKLMQDSFAYYGDRAPYVFAGETKQMWYYFMPLIAIFLLLMFIRRKQASLARVKFSRNERVWRCTCGRLNHEPQTTCRRCGQQSPSVPIR